MEQILKMLEVQDRKLAAVMKSQTQLVGLFEELIKLARGPVDEASNVLLEKLEQSITRQTEVLQRAIEPKPQRQNKT